MRALRPMTQEEREFAEQHHDLVIDFLRYKRLSIDDFYDVVIFGYPNTGEQECRFFMPSCYAVGAKRAWL